MSPDCVVMGGRLTEALRQQAGQLQIPMDAGALVESVEPGTATLRLKGGREFSHAALAVACGIPSDPHHPGLSNLLNQRSWQPAGGFRLLQAIGTRAEPARDHGRFLTTWIADGLVAVEHPLPSDDGTQRLSLSIMAPAAADDEDPAALMHRLLGRAHPHLRHLFDEVEVFPAAEPASDCAEFWFAEKLALLGGACHAHPPFPEITPSAALEDAWVLSRMMERWEDEPHQGFSDYERYRKPRARRLRAFSENERQNLMIADPFRAWRRNLSWSLTSRFLPEITLQKTDWLYGYDCIRGFV